MRPPSPLCTLSIPDRHLVEGVEIFEHGIGRGSLHEGLSGEGAAGDAHDALAVGGPGEVVVAGRYLHVFVGSKGLEFLSGEIQYVEVGRRLRVEAADHSQPPTVRRDPDTRGYEVLAHAGSRLRCVRAWRHAV